MSNDRTVLKVGIGISFVVAALTLLYTHESGELFPWLPIGAVIAVGVLFAAAILHCRSTSEPSYVSVIAPLVVLSVGYRTYVFLFPASLVGIDPAGYAVQVARVMTTGQTEAIGFTYYSEASLSITYPAVYGILADVSASDALLVYPIVVGIAMPLITAALVMRVSDRETVHVSVVTAATLASVAAVSIRFSYWPIAQTLGLLYWLVFSYLLTQYFQTRSKRTFLVLVTVLVALTFTHKLPLLVIFGVLGVLALWSGGRYAYGRVRPSELKVSIREPSALLIGLITGTLMMVQWTYLTEFIEVVVVRAVSLLVVESAPIGATQTAPEAAIPPGGGVLGLLARRAHGIALLVIGGAAWVYLAIDRNVGDREGLKILLVFTTIPVVLLGFGIVAQSQTGSTSAPSPNRFVSFAEPILIAIIALPVGGYLARTSETKLRHGVARHASKLRPLLFAVFVVALVSTQLLSAPAAPDHQSSARYYLTSQEADAKSFGYDYAIRPIHTDWYTTIAGPPTARLSGELERYEPIGEPFLTRNVTQQEYEYVLYRSDVRYYATEYGPRRLLWEPSEQLDKEYNRVYANGGSVLYDRGETAGVAESTPD
jgi:uncharacterized protein with PQ loop repeat